MVSRYPGEAAFLGSYKAGNFAQHRFSSCEEFLLPPHPQVLPPVSRKRIARSYAGSLIREAFRLNSSPSIRSGKDFSHKISASATPKSARMRKSHFMVLAQPRCC
jgi:hypothetical protein